MMKTAIFVMCWVLLANSTAMSKEHVVSLSEEGKKKFESVITSLYEEYGLQGGFLIGLVGEDGLAYSYGISQKSLAGDVSALNNDTPFYIASHTKALTGTLVKILEEEGKVDLDNSLHDYLPELFAGNDKVDAKSIKVRQLLNHTAGFTSILHSFKTGFLGHGDGDKELIQALNHKTLSAPPGEFRYSNTGPIVAAMIVEKVTGNSWQEEMRRRIFTPLKMNNTSSKVSDYQAGEILPSIETNGANQVFRSAFYKQDVTMHAAGGTISTINDMAKWLRFNIAQERSIIKNKTSFVELHQATTTQTKTYFTYKRHGYSLGWDIATYHDETILTRFGGTAGMSFHASFMPSKKIGIVAFSNEQRAYLLPHLMANYLYNLALKRPDAEEIFKEEKASFQRAYDDETKRSFSKAMLLGSSDEHDELIGTYRNNDGWPELTIVKSDDRYLLKWGVLSGPIMESEDPKRPFLATLGPLNRDLSLMREGGVSTLMNGSLKYHKIKKPRHDD